MAQDLLEASVLTEEITENIYKTQIQTIPPKERLKNNLVGRYKFSYLVRVNFDEIYGQHRLQIVFQENNPNSQNNFDDELNLFETSHDHMGYIKTLMSESPKRVVYGFEDLHINPFVEKHSVPAQEFYTEKYGVFKAIFKDPGFKFFKSVCPLEELKTKIENKYDINIYSIFLGSAYKQMHINEMIITISMNDEKNSKEKVGRFIAELSTEKGDSIDWSTDEIVNCKIYRGNSRLENFVKHEYGISPDALLRVGEKEIRSETNPSKGNKLKT